MEESEIELVLPSKELEEQALDYKKEHFDNNEFILHGSALWDKIESYDTWLKKLKENSSEETVNPNWVAATTFFGIRKSDKRIVGMIDIRHRLNELLSSYGGNIGYGVRPSERRKGYATEMLKLALEYCREQLNLSKVMLTCYKENEKSRNTILKCGGVLEEEFLHTDGKVIQKFWITI